MRDTARIIRICELLKAAWYVAPDQRLGQFLMNLLRDGEEHMMFNLEDDIWEERIKRLAKEGKWPWE